MIGVKELLIVVVVYGVIIGSVLLCIGIGIALIVTRKEKKEQVRVTAEAEKIDAMATKGKITADEARELKQALGPVAFTQTSREPDIHINVIGILNIVFGCQGVLFLSGILFVFGIKGVRTPGGSTCTVIFGLVLLFILAIFILRIISGVCLMKGAPWTRIAIIVFAILGIVIFPLGTALSIYTLWALLLRDDAGGYFVSHNTIVHKVAASILFLTSLPLWAGLIYLLYFFPRKLAILEQSDTSMSVALQFVTMLYDICHRCNFIIFPSLCFLTLGPILWFVIVSKKDGRTLADN